jgi:hypothetical protein
MTKKYRFSIIAAVILYAFFGIVYANSFGNALAGKIDLTPSSCRPDTVIFIALERVMIIVDQKNDNKRLYQGTLTQGERVSLEADGPIVVRYDHGDSLMVERHGQRYRMEHAGMGYNSIP